MTRLAHLKSNKDKSFTVCEKSQGVNLGDFSNRIQCEHETRVSAVKTRGMVKKELTESKNDCKNSEN